jgi:hypothetical protein
VVAIAALEARKTSSLSPLDATEERLIGLVQTRQHVLQDVAVNGGVFREVGPNILQLRFLLIA